MKKFKNSEVQLLKDDLLLQNREISSVAELNKYYQHIFPDILSAFNSTQDSLSFTRGWINKYNINTPINTNEMHNHADDFFLKHGNYLLLQVLETGKYTEDITFIDENNNSVDIPVTTGDVLVFSAYTIHGLKKTNDKLEVAAFAITL
jgi:beta-galactosidase beta subunit